MSDDTYDREQLYTRDSEVIKLQSTVEQLKKNIREGPDDSQLVYEETY